MAKMRSNIHVTFEVNAGSDWIMLHEKHRSHREAPSGNTQKQRHGKIKFSCMHGRGPNSDSYPRQWWRQGRARGLQPPSEEILDSRRRKFGKVTHEKTIFPSF